MLGEWLEVCPQWMLGEWLAVCPQLRERHAGREGCVCVWWCWLRAALGRSGRGGSWAALLGSESPIDLISGYLGALVPAGRWTCCAVPPQALHPLSLCCMPLCVRHTVRVVATCRGSGDDELQGAPCTAACPGAGLGAPLRCCCSPSLCSRTSARGTGVPGVGLGRVL